MRNKSIGWDFTAILLLSFTQRGCFRPSINGTEANLSVLSTPSFSTTSLNNTTTATLNLGNSGQTSAKSVTVTGLIAPFSYLGGTFPGTGGSCTATIPPDTSCTIILTYSPTSGVSHSNTVGVEYSAGKSNQSLSVSLSGIAVPQGIPDTTFSGDGFVEIGFAAYNEVIRDLVIRTDGKIVLIGNADDGAAADTNISLVRLNSDGGVDTAFGVSGKASADSGSNAADVVQAGYQLSNSSILVGGTSGTTMLLARFLSGGTLDTTFGINGIATLSKYLVLNSEAIYDLTVDSSGKIIVVGETDPVGVPPLANSQMLVRRYDSTGLIPDTTFGVSGDKAIDFTAAQDDRALAIKLQSDGKIVVAGYTESAATRSSVLARLEPTMGALDTTFNITGQRIVDLCGLGLADQIEDIAITSILKIVAVGSCDTAGTGKDVAIAQFNEDGSLDTAFGVGGVVKIDISGGDDVASRVSLQSDGKIAVAGYATVAARERFLLLKLNSDGSMDTAFATNGVQTSTLGTSHARAQGMALQTDGRIVLGGYSLSATSDYAAARYFP